MFYHIYTNNYDAAKAKNSCDHEIELLTASFARLELTCLPTPMEVEFQESYSDPMDVVVAVEEFHDDPMDIDEPICKNWTPPVFFPRALAHQDQCQKVSRKRRSLETRTTWAIPGMKRARKAKNSFDHEIELLTASFARLELTFLPTPMEVDFQESYSDPMDVDVVVEEFHDDPMDIDVVVEEFHDDPMDIDEPICKNWTPPVFFPRALAHQDQCQKVSRKRRSLETRATWAMAGTKRARNGYTVG
jgi:hypothetical protein